MKGSIKHEDMQPIYKKAIRRIGLIFALKIIGILLCAAAFLRLVYWLAFLKF